MIRTLIFVAITIILQGCSSTAHLLSYATTSPDKICRFTTKYKGKNETAKLLLSIEGGISGYDALQKAEVVNHGAKLAGRPIWSFVSIPRPASAFAWAPQFGYFDQPKPCVAVSEMVLKVKRYPDSNDLEVRMPLKDVLPNPVWGEIFLTIDEEHVQLTIRENLGKTRYSTTLMENVWSLEPERILFAQEFSNLGK